MRAVIQRVKKASVTINGLVKSSIQLGLLVLLGIEEADHSDDIKWLAGKIVRLRIFEDDHDVMNLSVQDVEGEVIVVSQFTLHASTKKGNRPSYIKAARPETAIPLYNNFVKEMESLLRKPVATGEFGAMMDIALVNSGPVTILIDTKSRE
ncbi:MAG: D-tyrosyl-tRNA(Tyr) deacylase [Bacteroidetes bacterium]|nr:MAG: D-tyrosyl-tRNA(Tyr) deacylase [Bacteroidota bacterium]